MTFGNGANDNQAYPFQLQFILRECLARTPASGILRSSTQVLEGRTRSRFYGTDIWGQAISILNSSCSTCFAMTFTETSEVVFSL